MNRCLNEVFGYCLREPHPIEKESYAVQLDYRGLTHKVPTFIKACSFDYHTCPDHLSYSQRYPVPLPPKSLIT